ncbi:hypothetical protein [Hymenobacter sp. YC55]|uniref:hypothetical protein n=1 Tax=Hymenobacter sp. YC55 TaxID=3034019 RepID=UPI0023F6BFEF|nr:hypothetical protein [Hymenobacter sp. YC55]MDF7810942.1 hypothetical protein [Hymenobacter sp. YC55]
MAHGYRPESAKWHNQTWLVLLLCLVVFPLGFYGLWKSKTIPPLVKAILVGACGYLLFTLVRAVVGHYGFQE